MSYLTPIGPTVLERSLGMPPEGPKCIPFNLDFSVSTSYSLDYSNMQRRAFLQMVQTIWVDNRASGVPLFITVAATGQVVEVPAAKQNYFTVLVPNPIKLQFDSAGAVTCQIMLVNFPVTPNIYS